jgi:hypothetical protein
MFFVSLMLSDHAGALGRAGIGQYPLAGFE